MASRIFFEINKNQSYQKNNYEARGSGPYNTGFNDSAEVDIDKNMHNSVTHTLLRKANFCRALHTHLKPVQAVKARKVFNVTATTVEACTVPRTSYPAVVQNAFDQRRSVMRTLVTDCSDSAVLMSA